MQSQIENLKDRVLGGKGKHKETELTAMLAMVREFSCLGEIIGRDFEIRDSKGNLVYTIRQKPMAICQLKTLLKEFIALKKVDAEIESAKWGTKNKGRLNKR